MSRTKNPVKERNNKENKNLKFSSLQTKESSALNFWL